MTRHISNILLTSCCVHSAASLNTVLCGEAAVGECMYDWIHSWTGYICIIYTAVFSTILITWIFHKMNGRDTFGNSTISDAVFCRLFVTMATSFAIESALLHHQALLPFYFPQCTCDAGREIEFCFCNIGVSIFIITMTSTLGCIAWSTGVHQGSKFTFVLVVTHTVSNLLANFVVTSPRYMRCDSTIWRVTRTFVMYSGNIFGILLVHLFNTDNNPQRTGVEQNKGKIENFCEELSKMSLESSKRPSQDLGRVNNDDSDGFDDDSPGYNKDKYSPKYRGRKKQHPLSSRFGMDAFLPCVVLLKKKGRSSPPVAVNVTNIGISANTKHSSSRHTHRRASLGVIKERGGGDEAATWARLSQRRRTSLPTTFHSSRKQTVMSSVLVDSSVIAELHSTLTELSVVANTSDAQVEICTNRMQKLLKPYKNENLCPSQVVWLHESISSTSDGSDDDDGRGTRGNFSKRMSARRQERNPDNVFTTTTSATGLPSRDPGPVKSKRLPKIQKTPSNTPHDSRCSSPTSGKELGSLSRRKTIHNIGGPVSSPGRPQTFFSHDDSSAGKDGRRNLFTSSDYESCDNLPLDGSEGENVRQMPDLQQPNPRRVEASSHDLEQSPKIRMVITEPTIDEGSEEDAGGNDCSNSNSVSDDDITEKERRSSGSGLSANDEEELCPDEIQKIFSGVEYRTELLEKVYSWNFPIFELADKTHCVLSQMAYKLFDDTGLFETFKIPRKPFVDYMRALENGYRNIPYHNRIHASDVLHGCWFLTTQQIPGFSETSPLFSSDSSDSDSGTAHTQVNTVGNGSLAQAIPALELMALYLAAAMHDYDHPGRTNAFLVETRHPLAMLYNDRSVLENHHASASWELLYSKSSYDFLINLDVPEWKRLRFLIVEAILATDLKKHFELMSKFSSKLIRRNDTSSEATEPLRHEGCLNWTSDEDRLLVCQMVIKLADIGGPTKIRDLHVTWTRAICQEFFTQGDEERKRGTPVSPFMDRLQPQVAQLQQTFIKKLIAPLVCKMHRAGILAGYAEDVGSGERGMEEDNILEPTEDGATISCRSLIREQLADNLRYWHSILQREIPGQEEMEEVFKCCHRVTLEHEDFDPVEASFPSRLSEQRRLKMNSVNSQVGTRIAQSK